jgi:hypothetical protein
MSKRSFFSPTFRSRRFGHRQLTAGAIVKIGLVTWLAPALVGLVLMLPFLLTGATPESVIAEGVLSLAGLLAISPMVGIFAVPFALLFGAWFMRFGLAGWVMPLLVTMFGPLVVGLLYQALDPTAAAVGAMLLLSPIIILHAVALWVATRLFCPAALIE